MRIAAAQHGAITAAQLAAAGIGRRAIARRLADGRLQRVHRGVYLAGPVESPHARASAALLAAGPTAVLSHRSAAELWELLSPARGPIELTATAWAAVKHSFEKVGDHWEPKDRKGPSDEQAKQGGAAARNRPKRTHGGIDVVGNTRDELYERAKRAGVRGRSKMSKSELADALARKQG